MAAEPEPLTTPFYRAWSAGGQAGAISLDYKLLHTERLRGKRRIKLFDRYFSSFSQRLQGFFWFYFFIVLHPWTSSIAPPVKTKLTYICPVIWRCAVTSPAWHPSLIRVFYLPKLLPDVAFHFSTNRIIG